MGLTKYKFARLIELCFIRNTDKQYDEDSAIGVNIDKEIRVMKGDTSNKDIEKFYVVKPGFFVYNPRGSRKLGLGYNDSENTYITTFNNMIFRVRDDAQEIVLPYYLFMYLSRPEWDRKAEMFSWGSSTEVFAWDTFCDMEIELPDITVQQKYVDIYKGMLQNQKCYERGLEDLKLVCDGYMDRLQNQVKAEKIGTYLELSEDNNSELRYGVDTVRGVSIEKKFITTKADMDGVSLKPYSIVKPREFAYVTVTSRNGGKISLAHNNTETPFLVSSSYVVFRVIDNTKLLPEYLMLFFSRPEFDRYARFHSWGSARETFDWSEMCDVKIPIPDIKVQQSIVNIYNAYLMRKEINEKLKAQIKDICPILIRGSLEEV